MHWKITTALVCIYGIVKEFRPATPFLTPFLESGFKNFTNAQLYSEVYPIWTYSYLIFLVPVFFLTDTLRYKPVVILEAVSLFTTWALLVWGQTIWQMQIMQVAFGLATSSEIAYYSYMYAVVDKKHYKKITSYTRAAKMIGKFFAYSSAQFLVSTNTGSYLLLNQISFGAVSITLLIAIVLPAVSKPRINTEVGGEEDFEVQVFETIESAERKPEKLTYWQDLKQKILIFKENRTVFVWSLWWALASCGIYQIGNYSQTLWAELQTEGQFVGNGLVECFNTLLGAILTFYLQYFKLDWKKHGEIIFFTSSICIGLLLFGMTQIRNIFVVYAFYLLSDVVYHILIAAASNLIASQLNSTSYSFIFGCNTFVALICQSVLTFLVADKHGFALDIHRQFQIYSGYFFAMAVIFSIPMIFRFLKQNQSV